MAGAAGAGGQTQAVTPANTTPMGAAIQSAMQPQAKAPNVFQQSAGAYRGALSGTAAAGSQMPDVAAFMNPYTQEVVDTTMQDIERQRQMAANQLGAQASAARAFGGSRQGVAEALTNQEFARQAAQTAANLRQQGYGQALSAAQRQQQLGLQAAGQLGNLAQMGYGFGTGITSAQQAYGQQQQALNQALIDAARGQYAGFVGAPQQSLNLPIQAVTAGNMGQGTQTQSYSPGLFNYLGMGAGLLATPFTGPAGATTLAGRLFG